MEALGRHILVELYNCSPKLLNDVAFIEREMIKAADLANATLINSTFHHFSPFGVSGVVVIQESHLAIHTWPEYGYAAIDLFTCGDSVNPWTAYKHLFKVLEAEHGSAMEMQRGPTELLEKMSIDLETLRDSTEEEILRPKLTRNVWFTDRNENLALSLRHTGNVLFRKRSPYQKVEVYETYGFGRMLAIDNMVMCTEKDEFAYHEMIAHVPMNVLDDPRHVLVIGGGDGGTIREVLRHSSVEKCTMVEIDETVIEASKKYLPSLASAFGHPKLDLKIMDGVEFVTNCPDEHFDLVIVDSTDPYQDAPSTGLFTEEFYRNVYRILKPHGVMVTQCESPYFNAHILRKAIFAFRRIFGQNNVHLYLAFIPTYPSGMWSFSFSSKDGRHPVEDVDWQKVQHFVDTHQLRYYNADVHRAAFALPTMVRELITKEDIEVEVYTESLVDLP